MLAKNWPNASRELLLDIIAENEPELVRQDFKPHGGRELQRVMGYDCAETVYARCPSERARGDAATRHQQQLLAGAQKTELIADRQIDRYGRQLGHLRVDGRDVGGILVQEGWCVPSSGRRQRRDWCRERT